MTMSKIHLVLILTSMHSISLVAMICPSGSYHETSSNGEMSCISCPTGAYSALIGATSNDTCTACPSSYTTAGLGSTSPEACTCGVGQIESVPSSVTQKVSIGYEFVCVIVTGGRVKCWGNNYYGNLGYGDSNNRGGLEGTMGDNLPFVDIGTGQTAVEIASGKSHTCVILSNAAVKCWGLNSDGQLGLGDSDSRGDDPNEMGDILPIIDLNGRRATALRLGQRHTCAIFSDTSMSCWGSNENAQLGFGNGDWPFEDGTENVDVYMISPPWWGGNSGEMGINLPIVAYGVKSMDTGTFFTCMILEEVGINSNIIVVKCFGKVITHGDNMKLLGRLESERGEQLKSLISVPVGGVVPKSVSCAKGLYVDFMACILFTDGIVKCFGLDMGGILGRGDGSSDNVGVDDMDIMGNNLKPVAIPEVITSISVGNGITCVILTSNEAKCWGGQANLYSIFALGYGAGFRDRGLSADSMYGELPALDPDNIRQIAKISTAYDTTCVVFSDGEIKCWGTNAGGSLGQGDTVRRGLSGGITWAHTLPVIGLGAGLTIDHGWQPGTPSGLGCESCLSDSYKITVGLDGCMACPVYSSSITTSGTKCVCIPGMQGISGDCTPCNSSMYNGEYDGSCMTCPPFSVSTYPAIDCSCIAGHEVVEGTCTPCGLNSFKPLSGNHSCTLCGSIYNPGVPATSVGATRCVCDANQYSGNNGHCIRCPLPRKSPVGSQNLGDCVCPTASYSSQQSTSMPITCANVVSIGIGNSSCANVYDGTSNQLKCWGSNWFGQLGLQDGNNRNRGDTISEMGVNLPSVDLGVGRFAISVSTASYHTCAVLDNQKVKCWGANGDYQLGYGDKLARGRSVGTMGDALPFVDLGTDYMVVDICASGSTVNNMFTCALFTTGTVKCWGSGKIISSVRGGGIAHLGSSPSQMGDNLPEIDLGISRLATQISCGSDSVCAILDNNQVKCWGDNTRGQLGVGNRDSHSGHYAAEMGDNLGAVRIYTDLAWVWGDFTPVSVSSGTNFHCVLTSGGGVACWGANEFGQCGVTDTNVRFDVSSNMNSNTKINPMELGTFRTAKQIATGNAHACALLDNDSVQCWGANTYGQLGVHTSTGVRLNVFGRPNIWPPVDISSNSTVISVYASYERSCALLSDYRLVCWGSNSHGVLGIGMDYTSLSTIYTNEIQDGVEDAGTITGGGTTESVNFRYFVNVYDWGAIGNRLIQNQVGSESQMGDALVAVMLGGDIGNACVPPSDAPYPLPGLWINYFGCVSCPFNTSTSVSGATTVEQCECPRGFGGMRADECIACSKNTFKYNISNTACIPCGVNSSTNEYGSSECKCINYYVNSATGGAAIANIDDSCVRGDGIAIVCEKDMWLNEYFHCAPCPVRSNSAYNNTRLSNCICLPTYGYKLSNGEMSCAKCLNNQYSDPTELRACQDCPTNSYGEGVAVDINGCRCIGGTYKPGGGSGAGCVQCESGTIQPASGMSSCITCNAGTMQIGNECVGCLQGTYTAKQVGNTICIPCNPGSFSTLYGAFSNATCILCPAGSVQPFEGQFKCKLCELGKFVSTAGNTECTSCIAGTYRASLDLSGGTRCSPCPPGYSTENMTGAALCTPCPPGTLSTLSGNAVCEGTCSAGTRLNYNQTVCELCPAGTSGDLDGGVCIECPKGTFQVKPGTVMKCTPCPAGTYSTIIGAALNSTCLSCPIGTYREDERGVSIDNCTVCAPGSFGSTVGSISSSECTLCPEGTYIDVVATTPQARCLPCPKGTFSTTRGASSSTSCTSCPAGSFGELEGAISLFNCTLCRTGTYSTPEQTRQNNSNDACIACPKGTYSNTMGVVGTNSSICSRCPAGTFSDALGVSSSLTCVLCSTGTYSTNTSFGATSNSTCLSCPVGTYSTIQGAVDVSRCILCPLGTYSTTPRASEINVCLSCVGGKYSTILGSNTSASCVSCAPGTYSETTRAVDSSTCIPCIAGTWSSDVASYSIDSCQQCPWGTYSNVTGARNYTTCTPCRAGTFSTFVGSTRCDLCAAGMYGTELERYYCDKCPRNTYNNLTGQTGCTNCPYGTKTYFTQAISEQNCTQCPLGTYMLVDTDQRSCARCPRGTYGDIPGSVSVDQCTPCFDNSDTGLVDALATNPSACTCIEGTIPNITEPNRCDALPRVYCNAFQIQDNAWSPCRFCLPYQRPSIDKSVCETVETWELAEYPNDKCNITQVTSVLVGKNFSTGQKLGFRVQPSVGSGVPSCVPDGYTIAPNGAYEGRFVQTSSCWICVKNPFDAPIQMQMNLTINTIDTRIKDTRPMNYLIVREDELNCNSYSDVYANTDLFQTSRFNVSVIKAKRHLVIILVNWYSSVLFDITVQLSNATFAVATNSAPIPYVACVNCLPIDDNTTQLRYAAATDVATSQCNIGCRPGTYVKYGNEKRNDSNFTCPLCEAGKFSEKFRQDSCTMCLPGSFQSNVGSTSCRLCPTALVQPLSGQTNCTMCSPGTVPDIITPGATACVSCPDGTVNNLYGMATCTPCGEGTYQNSTNFIDCQLCERGKYGNRNGWTSCENCNIGYYQNNTGQSKCLECPYPLVSGIMGGAEICTQCSVGKTPFFLVDCRVCNINEIPTTAEDYWSNPLSIYVKCKKCPPGTERPINSTECIACPAGNSYEQRITSWQYLTCELCASGMYAVAGNTPDTCTFCEAGTATNKTGSYASCDECQTGKYRPYVNRTNWFPYFQIKTELVTRPNPFWDERPIECFPCPIGTYQNRTKSLECTLCPDLLIGTATGLSICTETCPDGKTPFVNKTGCEYCAVGKFWANGVCLQCPPGTFGYYMEANLTFGCSPCNTTGNLYQDESGSTSCKKCPPGSESKSGGGIFCTGCPRGTFFDNTTSVSCVSCPVGTQQNLTGQLMCNPCDADTKTVSLQIGARTCEVCPSGSVFKNASYCPCITGHYRNYT